ncbi:hypothetical protein [Pontiella agarivorans]|uniref:Lipoprotein n=1 Tax=Pontiella agarivorans TaxID=3038953 RepID=A0ABU5N007_9BACT|nr:hypothetical protein [Pontiella agarivorans]MDZ8119546.1 hypothetical protein [Pontiella agarivorans]
MRWFFAIAVWIAVLISGCSTMINGVPDGPIHAAYQPLGDPEAEAFFFQCLDSLEEQYGKPDIPVKDVIFRRSRKNETARRYRIAEDFSLTQCINPDNGEFVVYIGVDADGKNYYPLLTHECGHFINARIKDWYIEGFATVFSEEICTEFNKPWGDWGRHFNRSRKNPYARSYRMMRDLKAACPEAYPKIIRFTKINGQSSEWLCIDIDAWLETLSSVQYDAALEIIEPHLKVLRRHTASGYTIEIPSALK